MNSQLPKLTWTAKWLFNLVHPYLKWVVLSSLSALTLIGFNILKAGLVAELVDQALQGNLTTLIYIATVLLPVTVLALLATWASKYGAGRASIMVVRDLKNNIIARITRAQVSEIEKYQAGELLTRTNKDMATLGKFLADQFPSLLYQPLIFLCSSLYLLSINWKLFSACYILLPFTFSIATRLNKKGANYGRQYHDGLDQANSMVKQCIDGIVTVKTYNLEGHILGKCRKAFDNVLGGLMKKELCDAVSLPFYFLTYESPRIICVLFGGYLTLQGEIGIGELVAATQLVGYVSAPAFALMRLLNGIRQTGVSGQRLAQVLSIPTEVQGSSPLSLSQGFAAARFRKVTYRYDAGDPVLDELDLEIPATGVTALVGASGAGKSTIINLLCGFHQAQLGEIKIFGQDISQLKPQDLRSLVAYVPQDCRLFPGSIEDNIRMGNPQASQAEIDRVLQDCHLDFVSDLPQGLKTVLGEEGRGLSGGQRQRVAIARAALKKAPLIVLDEPTSALDRKSEGLINRTLENLAQSTAVLVISHRLSTVMEADNIVVLDQGKVVEQGKYPELLDIAGSFVQLFESQISAEEAV